MALTKVAGDILDPGISVAGVVTATAFDGPFRGGSGKDITAGIGTFTELDVNGDADISGTLTVHQNATFNGNVSIAKTLTYEDVTNIDSVGVITARDAIVISEDNAIHFRGIATDDNDAILRASAGGGQLLINSRNDTILNIDSNGDSTDAHFAIGHGAATGSSTELLRVHESGFVAIGRTTKANDINKLIVHGTSPADNYDSQLFLEGSETSGAVNTGGALAFGGHDGSTARNWGNIYGMKENGTGGNTASYMSFHTRPAGGAVTERVRINSSGLVGIGTIIPESGQLQVIGNGYHQINISANKTADANKLSGISFLNYEGNRTSIVQTYASSSSNTIYYGSADSTSRGVQYHNFYVNTDQDATTGHALALRINTDKTVGINTTSSGGDGLGIMVDNNSTNVLATGSIALNLKNKNTTDNTWVSMDFNNSVGGIVGRFGAQFKDTSDKDTDLYFATREDGGSLTERMRIYSENNDSAGQVKITAPNSGDMLNLQNSTGGGQGLIFGVDTTNHTTYWKNNSSSFYDATFILGSVERLRITGEGSVGIGTTDPGADLHLQVARANLLVEGTNDTVGGNVANVDVRAPYYRKAGYSISDSGGNEDFWIGRPYGEGDSNAAIAINMGGVEKVRLTSTGNLTLTGSTANLFTSDSYNILELRADENNDGGNDDVIFKFTHDGTFRSEMRYDESSSTLEISTADNRDDFSMDTDGKVTFAQEIATPQDYPTIRPTLDFNFAAVKKLDPRITYYRTGPASYVDEKGLVRIVGDDAPRFDHDPETGECRGLLIEETRISKLTQSTHNKSYSGYKQTNQGETIKGPDGVENSAREYTANSDAGTGGSTTVWASEAIGMASGVSVSYFVKITKGSTIAFQIMDNNNARESEKVVLSGGYITDGSYATVSQNDPGSTEGTTSYERYPNGWVKVKWEGASGSGNATSYLQLYIYDHANSNGSNIGYAIWGFQVESGAFCTSTIPKPTTAAVTRNQEFAFMDGQDFTDAYNISEGTFILNASNDDFTTSNQGTWGVEKSTNRSGFFNMLGYRVGGGDNPGDTGAWYMNNGSTSMFKNMAVASTGVTVGVPYKTALAYKVNDMAATTNGITVQTDTSASIATGGEYDRFSLGSYHYDSMSTGHIQRVMYYRKRLPDTQLVTLTS